MYFRPFNVLCVAMETALSGDFPLTSQRWNSPTATRSLQPDPPPGDDADGKFPGCPGKPGVKRKRQKRHLWKSHAHADLRKQVPQWSSGVIEKQKPENDSPCVQDLVNGTEQARDARAHWTAHFCARRAPPDRREARRAHEIAQTCVRTHLPHSDSCCFHQN